MRLLLATLLFCFSTLVSAAETRFDSLYFFQSEETMQAKGITIENLGRYSRKLQSAIYRSLKAAKLPPSSGYLIVAIRSDGAVTSWLDMKPAVHEFYDNQIYDVVQKLPVMDVKTGIFVFAIKMSLETPVFTKKPVPEPADWVDAKKKLNNPNDIEQLVFSVWPE
ncbi:hypothetical protein H8K32_08430 [Undibacterium jejuense]|uniref:DUF4136 domain-containing protein n=1 Tax=Undibacterium jejuense TaxID=1344949 RepID=A0A923HE64_9BURK|nr:hypothetical protein [Undibacterium jejuense]MBC3862119.1 hypothetical protein [Undibacterium jejuense]